MAPQVMVGFVHGDLHLSNIVVRGTGPAFVDFAWAGMGDHACKDFVLVESSLRFMRFPRTVHPAVLEEVDQLLNERWSCDAAAALVVDLPDSKARTALKVMVTAVQSVRDHADVVGEQFLDPDLWHREELPSHSS